MSECETCGGSGVDPTYRCTEYHQHTVRRPRERPCDLEPCPTCAIEAAVHAEVEAAMAYGKTMHDHFMRLVDAD